MELPKYVWGAKGGPTSSIFAVAQSAVQGMLVASKKVCDQYKEVDLKMPVFTTNEMRLWEGADKLREKLGIQLKLIALVGRQIGMCGGGHRCAKMADPPPPPTTRNRTIFHLPQWEISSSPLFFWANRERCP